MKRKTGLKSVSEKLRFCDGLVWTVGLTVEYLRFPITPALVVWTGLWTFHVVVLQRTATKCTAIVPAY